MQLIRKLEKLLLDKELHLMLQLEEIQQTHEEVFSRYHLDLGRGIYLIKL